MKSSSLCFRAAILIALTGMVWGAAMGATGDHATHPAHAHLNLLGFVALFLFGLFYHLHPALDATRLARMQVWAWIAGSLALAAGVAMIHTGRPGEPIAGVASVVLILDMATFGWIVLRRDAVVLPRVTLAE